MIPTVNIKSFHMSKSFDVVEEFLLKPDNLKKLKVKEGFILKGHRFKMKENVLYVEELDMNKIWKKLRKDWEEENIKR